MMEDLRGEAAIRFSGIAKRKPNFKMGPVSLEIPAGFITAIVGPNGSGKSTLFKMALDLEKPDDGTITVLGHGIGHGDDAEMKQRVRDYGYYDRQEQRVTGIGARTGYNPSKRSVKGIADCHNKLHEPGAAAGGQQRQQEPHAEQRVDYPEDVIDNLGNSRQSAAAFDFALSVNDLVNSLRAEFTGDLINTPHFARRSFCCGAFADFGLNFAFNLTLY